MAPRYSYVNIRKRFKFDRENEFQKGLLLILVIKYYYLSDGHAEAIPGRGLDGLVDLIDLLRRQGLLHVAVGYSISMTPSFCFGMNKVIEKFDLFYQITSYRSYQIVKVIR